MKNQPRLHPTAASLICTAALLLPASSLLAQATSAGPAESPPTSANQPPVQPVTNNGTKDTRDDETLALSPFVVKEDQDTGYESNDTLAGTRLRSPLKDLGASISVITPKFMEDTASKNMMEMLVYQAGVEVTGIGGNFSGNSGGSNANFEDARNNPNPVTRLRGLAPADLTRNYFTTIIPLDSYNSSGVTINRGANSILFGLGSPSGIIEMSTNQPLFRDHYRVSFNADEYGSFRQSIDFENVIWKNKLSIRVDAVNGDSKYEQDFAYSKIRRYYGAIEFRPFKYTTFRLNAEHGYQHQRLPRPNPPVDGITSWFTYFKQTRSDNVYTPANTALRSAFERLNDLDAALGFTAGLNQPSVFYGNASNLAPSGITAAMPLWATAVIPNQGTFLYRMLGVRQTTDARNFAFANPPTNGQLDPILNNIFSYNTMMLDRSVFDYRKEALYGPNDFSNVDFNTVDFSAEQLFFGGDAGINFAYDHQENQQNAMSNFVGSRGDSIGIDINQQLTNGQPNPNFGRIVVSGLGSAKRVDTENTVFRGTGFIRHDFRKDFHSWFGRLLGTHNFTAFYTDEMAKVWTINAYNAVVAPSYQGAGITNAIQNRQLNAVVYIGPSLLNSTSAAGAHATGIQSTIQWPSTLTSYTTNANTGFVWAPRTDDVYVFDESGRDLSYLANGISNTRQENISYGEVLQSYWLDGLLVSTLGWRHDQVQNFVGSVGTFDPVTGARPLIRPTALPQLASRNTTFSQGYVLHMPKKWVEKIPDNLDFSVYLNRSENFRLSPARVTIFNEPIAPEGGNTKEYGLGLSAFHGKLNFRITHYETIQENVTDPRVTTSSNLLTAVANAEQLIINNLTPAQIAATGYKGLDNITQTSPVFQRYMQVWGFRTTGDRADGTRDVTFTAPVGVADITGAQSRGLELEMTYNPLPNWRITANATKQDAVRGITAPSEDALFADRFPQWQNPALLSALQFTTFPSFVTLRTQAYYTAQITENQAVQELVKWRANLVTNYDFKIPMLKGFSVGGAASWSQGITTGFPVITSPNDPTLLVNDTKHPFRGKDIVRYDMWLGYSHPIFNKKIVWKVQVNVRNLLNQNLMITTAVNPVAVNDLKHYIVAQQVIGLPRSFQLTSSFDF